MKPIAPKLPPLYPKQREAILSPARYTIIEATTKAGKTAGCLIWMLAEAWNKGREGRNWWWVAPVIEQAKIAFRRLKKMLRQFDPQQVSWEDNETERTIKLHNGGMIWFKGADHPDTLYGEDVHGAVIDEATRCFIAGTPVETPDGFRPIESLRVGDRVLNAAGVGKVLRIIKKTSRNVAVVRAGERKMVSSIDHRYFTRRGWVEARHLEPGDILIEQRQAMCMVRNAVHGQSESAEAAFLQSELLCEMENVPAGIEGAGPVASDAGEVAQRSETMVGGSAASGAGCRRGSEYNVFGGDACEGVGDDEGSRTQAASARRERHGTDRTAETFAGSAGGGVCAGILCTDGGEETEGRTSIALLDRHCASDAARGRGDRRQIASRPKKAGIRSAEGYVSNRGRVDSVEILESDDHRFRQLNVGADSVHLYDLRIAAHPSYSVNGFLVHNCKEESWHAVRTTLTATGGPVKIIGNVRGRKNWAYRLAQRAKAGQLPNAAHFKLTAYDAVEGGILPASEVEDAKRMLPERVFKELYLAEPSDDGGNPFGLEALAKCKRDGFSGRPVAAWGVDLAKSVDWVVACGLDDAGDVAALERWQGDWGMTRRRLAELINDAPALVDSTGVGDPIVEDLCCLLPEVEGFKFTPQSKQQIMEGLAAAVQQREVGIPEGWLMDECESFEFEYRPSGIVRYSAPEGMTDDGVCALALANSKLRAVLGGFVELVSGRVMVA